MKSYGASGKPWLEKLTLENYINLEHMDTISIHILRKDALLDAVRSIELMEVYRSTLQSDVSSNAFLSLNDVIRDLSLLPWQECCITHIEAINSVTDFEEKPTVISVPDFGEKPTITSATDYGEKPTIKSVTDFGEKPSPKRLKSNCNRNIVVNRPDTLSLLQKQIMDQNSTMGDAATKRSDRVKKAPNKWKDFVLGATLPSK